MLKKLFIILSLILIFTIVSCQVKDDIDDPVTLKFQLTFMLDETTIYKTFEVEIGQPMIYPEDPSLDDHIFIGWYANLEEFSGDKVVPEALTLYAKFQPIQTTIEYKVTFKDENKSTLLEIAVLKGDTLKDYHLPSTTRQHYQFKGWFIDEDCTISVNPNNYEILEDTILYGKWTNISGGGGTNPNPGEFTGYYASLSGLSGNALVNAVKDLIRNTGKSTGTTKQVKQVDYYNGTYYLIYDGNGAYGNREHVWPQSKLGSVKDDLHNLRAANKLTNSKRSNYPYTDGTGTQWQLKNNAFYPGSEHVGDVARIVLYMSIRQNLSLNAVGNLDMFLRWHYQDPVNDFERHRNNEIYKIQQNRNPFIDYPDLVYTVFGYPSNYVSFTYESPYIFTNTIQTYVA
ncbi:MAG TPA: hypothetical protein GYA04_00680 [Acholeplasma sp.]|nr:hypothetical protein [Acholeplasma sp.]